MVGGDQEMQQLVEQFSNMSATDRKAILRKLPPKLRARFKHMVSGKHSTVSAVAPVYEEEDIKTLDQNDFSDWMLALLDQRKRTETRGLRKDFSPAPRTARTLSRLLGHENALNSGAIGAERSNPPSAANAMAGTVPPSLFDRMGGIFARKPVQS